MIGDGSKDWNEGLDEDVLRGVVGDGIRMGPAAVGISTVPLRWSLSGTLSVTLLARWMLSFLLRSTGMITSVSGGRAGSGLFWTSSEAMKDPSSSSGKLMSSAAGG